MLILLSHRLKQLLWDRLEESGWRYDVEEHAKGNLPFFLGAYSRTMPHLHVCTSIARLRCSDLMQSENLMRVYVDCC